MLRSLRPFLLPLSILLGIIIIGAGAAFFLKFSAETVSPTVFSTSPRFLLNSGVPEWYALEGNQAILAPGPIGFDKTTVSVVDSARPLADGSTPVLAVVLGESGVAYGLIKPDGTFVPVVVDGTNKQDLAVRADGLAAFSFSTVSKTVAESAPLAVWAIGIFNPSATTPTVRALGAGKPLAFTKDGGLVGITSAGIVHFEPVAWNSTTIVSREDLPVGGYTISPDASRVALENPLSHGIDVFSLDETNPTIVSYLGSVPKALFPFAFLGGVGSLIGKSDDHTMLVYDVSAKGFSLTQTVTYKKETP